MSAGTDAQKAEGSEGGAAAVEATPTRQEVRIFLSYHFGSADPFVRRVAYFLRKQPGVAEVYLYPPSDAPEGFREEIGVAIGDCEVLVAFVSGLGSTQKQEIGKFRDIGSGRYLTVLLDGCVPAPEERLYVADGADLLEASTAEESHLEALKCAEAIIRRLDGTWVVDDDIPPRYTFDYEKDVIGHYSDLGNPVVAAKLIDDGCPPGWPTIERVPWSIDPVAPAKLAIGKLGRGRSRSGIENPLSQDEIGSYRAADDHVVVDARDHGALPDSPVRHLTFPEAGPRQRLFFPKEGDAHLMIGIVVSGGIAPGINAVIEGIVARHILYKEASKKRNKRYTLRIRGYLEGMSGLLGQGDYERTKDLTEDIVRKHAYLGGSLLQTARADELLDPDPVKRDRYMDQVLANLKADGIDILYVVGGDGSMRAAHAIWAKAQRSENELSVVAIPKTMDNDILWVWQAFGFLSAVDQATDVIRQLHTEVTSNPRLCVVQLFGSDSGFVVSHAGLASGIGMCDAVLIPEVPFSMKALTDYILDRLSKRNTIGGDADEHRHRDSERPFGLIALAETAIPIDVGDYLEDPEIGLTESEKREIRKFEAAGRRVRGQTPDDLRTGGVKIVSRVLEREIRRRGEPRAYWQKFRVFTNEPRHLLRALPPSVSDVTFGQRLGTLAVDNAMAGYTDFMVSQWLTEYVLVPLRAVTLGRKRVPTDGIFWKSVLAATGQPADLTRPRRRSE